MQEFTFALPLCRNGGVALIYIFFIVLVQAVEAKEGLELRPTGRTAAMTTFQSFFGFYDRVAGMTVRSAGPVPEH